jgi:hypothetical protein
MLLEARATFFSWSLEARFFRSSYRNNFGRERMGPSLGKSSFQGQTYELHGITFRVRLKSAGISSACLGKDSD